MPDFTVPHLSLGQSDERSAGMNQRVGILPQQPVIRRLARKRDGIGFGFGAISPAVKNRENEWFRTRHRAALSSWLLAFGAQKAEMGRFFLFEQTKCELYRGRAALQAPRKADGKNAGLSP